MIRLNIVCAILIVVGAGHLSQDSAMAQQVYWGGPAAGQYYWGNGITGYDNRALNYSGLPNYGYGQSYGGYDWYARNYHDQIGSGRAYYSSGISSGLLYSNGSATYGGLYGSGPNRYVVSPPPTVVIGGGIPSRTIINNATPGTVREYTHNGNGYISTPGSSYQSVISSGPSIFPYTTVVQPAQAPVIIESRPTETVAKTFSGSSSGRTIDNRPSANAEIQLICPKDFGFPIAYLLNGTAYTIKPGYSQTFSNDRHWTIEFLRGQHSSQRVRYELTAGLFRFVSDEKGWDLKRFPAVAEAEIPPPPAPPEQNEPAIAPAPSPSPDL